MRGEGETLSLSRVYTSAFFPVARSTAGGKAFLILKTDFKTQEARNFRAVVGGPTRVSHEMPVNLRTKDFLEFRGGFQNVGSQEPTF